MKRSDFIVALLMLVCVSGLAQPRFQYKRTIGAVGREGWHSIALPPDLYKDINRDMSDIRLYAVHEQDTAEIPYLLDVRDDELTEQTVDLPLFNKSVRNGVLYLTFELKQSQKVNYIDLKFHDLNYFGLVTMEGSDDRQQWFEVIKDQRIVSIRNGVDDYVLCTVNFPVTNYRFLRFSVQSDVPLTFDQASFQYHTVKAGSFNNIPLTWTTRQDKKTKRSFVDIRLRHYAPLSSIQVRTDSAGLFYRPMQIEYVRDSSRTDKGWIKYYQTLYDGHLTSYKANDFVFDWELVRELRMVLQDSDNGPLKIQQISAGGPEIHLISLLKPGNNFMLYGADAVSSPSYDLVHFENRIPEVTTFASLGSPEKIVFAEPDADPLFENKLWLWGLMVLMILALGFFTVKMMKQKGATSP
jgi:hypothetical protein